MSGPVYERFPSLPCLRRLVDQHGWSVVAPMGIPSYVHPNPLARWFAWRKLEVAARLIGGGRVGKALDFGCGAGTMLRHLSALADVVYAYDADTSVARQVCADQGLDRVAFLDGPEALAGIDAGSLGLVVALEVLEHVEDLGRVSESLARLLAPSGRLVVSLPTENVFYRLGRRVAGFRGDFHKRGSREAHERLEERFQVRRRWRIPCLAPLYEITEYVQRKHD